MQAYHGANVARLADPSIIALWVSREHYLWVAQAGGPPAKGRKP